MVEIVKTHTGQIFVDREKHLEFLTVGDYGKENNIKADFLGLTKEINGVAHKAVDLTKKWVATISTQKGCAMRCRFCDCPKYGYRGDVSPAEFDYQIKTILQSESIDHTERLNVHFARMGEPTFNFHVIDFDNYRLREIVHEHIKVHLIAHKFLCESLNRRKTCQIKLHDGYGSFRIISYKI